MLSTNGLRGPAPVSEPLFKTKPSAWGGLTHNSIFTMDDWKTALFTEESKSEIYGRAYLKRQ